MKTLISFALTVSMMACQAAYPVPNAGQAVSVEIQGDDGHRLNLFNAGQGSSRFYAEATRGQAYRILVRNNLNRRVGLVVAVDGRNIISGQKSWLQNHERMYVLEPYESGEYAGWRSAQDRINRFYFTNVQDSYASAFGDESAMGLIAVAVYPEQQQRIQPPPRPRRGWWPFGSGKESGAVPQEAPVPSMEGRSESKKAAPAPCAPSDQAGTGYGHEEYSPSYTVSFRPEAASREKILIKYEWRETLVRMGILRPYRPENPGNRLWDSGYAPPPPPRWR